MPQTGELLWYIMWISVVGLGAMLIGILAARAVRKRLGGRASGEGFTIQQLREMRDSGRITQEEYEAMRAVVIGQAATETSTAASERTGPRPPGGPEVEDDTEGAEPDPAPEDQD